MDETVNDVFFFQVIWSCLIFQCMFLERENNVHSGEDY